MSLNMIPYVIMKISRSFLYLSCWISSSSFLYIPSHLHTSVFSTLLRLLPPAFSQHSLRCQCFALQACRSLSLLSLCGSLSGRVKINFYGLIIDCPLPYISSLSHCEVDCPRWEHRSAVTTLARDSLLFHSYSNKPRLKAHRLLGSLLSLARVSQ